MYMEIKSVQQEMMSEFLVCSLSMCILSMQEDKEPLNPVLPGANVCGVQVDSVLFKILTLVRQICAGTDALAPLFYRAVPFFEHCGRKLGNKKR
eukprot:787240-Ditylum_brightwellii.AAC.1